MLTSDALYVTVAIDVAFGICDCPRHCTYFHWNIWNYIKAKKQCLQAFCPLCENPLQVCPYTNTAEFKLCEFKVLRASLWSPALPLHGHASYLRRHYDDSAMAVETRAAFFFTTSALVELPNLALLFPGSQNPTDFFCSWGLQSISRFRFWQADRFNCFLCLLGLCRSPWRNTNVVGKCFCQLLDMHFNI